jgi:hypothetical protein
MIKGFCGDDAEAVSVGFRPEELCGCRKVETIPWFPVLSALSGIGLALL